MDLFKKCIGIVKKCLTYSKRWTRVVSMILLFQVVLPEFLRCNSCCRTSSMGRPFVRALIQMRLGLMEPLLKLLLDW